MNTLGMKSGRSKESASPTKLRLTSKARTTVISVAIFLSFFLLSFIYNTIVLQTPPQDSAAAALKDTSAPSLSTSLSPSNLTIASYTPDGSVGTGAITATTTTNNPRGYNIVLTTEDANTCLRHTSAMSSNCSDSGTANKKLLAGNLVGDNQWSWSNNGGTTWTVPQNNTGTTKLFELTNGPYINDARTITMGVKANQVVSSGAYQNTLVLSVTPGHIAAPTITSVFNKDTAISASGPTIGGTQIDIIGTNLDTAYQVFIDKDGDGVQDSGEQCASPNIISETKITCTAPSHNVAQARDVVVNTWGGDASKGNGFTYFIPDPDITSVSPSTGHFRGGETVTIGGYGFTGATAVRIGESDDSENDCYSFTVISDTEITCVVPGVAIDSLGGLGNVMMSTTRTANTYVVTSGGNTLSGSNMFTYRYANKSTTLAGSYMDVLGTDIALGSKIYVGGIECTNIKITGSTTATCNTPVTTNGVKTVTIQAPPASVGNMQNWSGCSAIPTPNYATANWWEDPQYTKILTDTRNGQDYRIRKMPDGRCWMIDNLKLANHTLTSADSNVSSSFTIPANPVQDAATRRANGICTSGTATGTGIFLTCDGTDNSTNANFSFSAYTDPFRSENSIIYGCTGHAVPSDSLTGCGYLYNWYTATAGTGSLYPTSGNASSSICPVGWKLPTGGSSGQFAILNNAMATGSTTPSATNDATTRPNWLSVGPFEGAAAGTIYNVFFGTGLQISYWSSSADASSGGTYSYALDAAYSIVEPGTHSEFKIIGGSVRCVL